ncbi:hypothetical protein LIER_03767 [Lithospermum erythrorhizon]|uniref:DUF4408 domain-containing protein n=1 Tax=Lithospermum erythrorhizon TaxID=34254 RepID=A0AAV3NUB9_LITER
MDGEGAYWATISSWFTPTIFFCLLNLMVATIYILSSMKSNKNNQEHQQNRLVNEENDPVHFFRVASFLERVKSINFSRSYHAEHEEITQHAEPENEPVKDEVDEEEEEEGEGHVARTTSDTIVESVVKKSVKTMKKSQSAKIVGVVEEREGGRQRPATMRETKGKVNGMVTFSEDEAVDAKADDFINRFKQQLKLQRIESLLKYRGASK